MLFITPDLENGRYLYLSTAFWVIGMLGLFSTPRGLTGVRAGVICAALLAGAAGVQMHLRSWGEAARLRDQVLAAAEDVLNTAPCRAVSLAGAPDSVRGAYVFRNGLAEALAFRTGASRSGEAAGGCTFAWDGSSFIRSGDDALPVQATVAR
jgi:hypothetical protein